MKKQILIPAAALAILSGSVVAQMPPAFAQTANAPQTANRPSAQTAHMRWLHRDLTARMDGRIAYLKAALKITPAQETQFGKLAQAIRENAADFAKDFQVFRATRGQHLSAVDRIEAQIKMAQFRVSARERYLTAFKPLYASLSQEQKQIADRLMAPHRFGRFHHRA